MSEYLGDENYYPPVILDNGSRDIKAGFAGDDGPFSVFPNIIGNSGDACFIGLKAQEKRELLALYQPVEHGIIVDWESMTKVWDFTFKELQVSSEQHPVLVAEPPLNPSGQREKFAQIMFEGYKTPAFYIALEPALALYSAGRTCGTMVDVGEGVTHVVPVADGMAPKHAVKRVDVAGRDVTRQLQELLLKKGLSFTTAAEIDEVREIKEKCCFVTEEPDKFYLNGKKMETVRHFELPDGKSIKLGNERYLCSEILFQKEGVNLGRLITDSIQSCDIVSRGILYSEIILSGGTTFLPGFKGRLEKDLFSLLPKVSTETLKIREYPERKYHVWIGGSILGSLSSFSQMWITKSEYNEYGPNIVHRKCV